MTHIVYRIADWEAKHEECLRRLRIGAGVYLVIVGVLGFLWR